MARIRKTSVSLPLYDTNSAASTTTTTENHSLPRSENPATPSDPYDHDTYKPHHGTSGHGNSFWRSFNFQKLLAATSGSGLAGTIVTAYALVWLVSVILLGPSGTGNGLSAALWGHEEVSRTGTSFRHNKYISKHHPIVDAAQFYAGEDPAVTAPKEIKFTNDRLIYPDVSEALLPFHSLNDFEEEMKFRELDDTDPHSAAKRAALEHARAVKQQERKKAQAKLEKSSLATTVFRSSAGPATSGPAVVLVLALNPETHSVQYMMTVLENRKKYAAAHGYGLYVRYTTDFKAEYSQAFDWEKTRREQLTETDPQLAAAMGRGPDGRPVKPKTWTWAKVAILKHALLAFPDAKHFWYLDAHAVVTDFNVRVTDRFVDVEALDSIMMRDAPLKLALPASAQRGDMDEDQEAYHYGDTTTGVKTYKNTQPQHTHLVVTQGRTGVNTASFLLTNLDRDGGREYAHALLDHWRDPLSRSYQGYRARETAALSHILHWHPSFLARTALVPTTQLAPLTSKSLWGLDTAWDIDEYNRLAYSTEDKSQFVAVLVACQYGSPKECLEEVISL